MSRHGLLHIRFGLGRAEHLSFVRAEPRIVERHRLFDEGRRYCLLPSQPYGRHTGARGALGACCWLAEEASRVARLQDSWDVDYQATLNCLEAGRAHGVKHFVLLSAICVQRPLLTFQKAKLKFEAALQAAGDVTYSIVRPTAFMKSLAGQVLSCKGGGPYVMFGDGNLASCKARRLATRCVRASPLTMAALTLPAAHQRA